MVTVRLNLYKYLLVLCLVGCGAPSPKSPSQGEPLSELQQKLVDLGAKAFKKLQDSGLFEGDIAINDPVALAKDLQTRASAILTERHVQRLDAFIDELKKDTDTQNNLIAIKNLYLKPSSEGVCPNPDWYINFIKKFTNDPNDSINLDLILDIRKGLYGSEGKLLKEILLGAAEKKEKKEALFAGMVIQECVKNSRWSPKAEWSCGGWYYRQEAAAAQANKEYLALMKEFQKTTLSENIDKFLALMGEKAPLDRDELTWTGVKLISLLNYQSLDWLHSYVKTMDKKQLKEWLDWVLGYLKDSKHENFKKLLVNLHPELRESGELILEHYTGKSLAKLDQKTFQTLLEKTSLILRDQEYGPIWYIRTYINPN
ncbi:MAG: hypothetical protein WCK42_02965 [Myxococcaceae bacterium]